MMNLVVVACCLVGYRRLNKTGFSKELCILTGMSILELGF